MSKSLEAITRHFESNRLSRIIVSCFIIGSVFAYLLLTTWQQWGDILVDTSREMWVPLQILEGKVLYKDIYWFHGFLPAYLIALLYKIFGVHLHTLIGCGIATALLMCFSLYKLSRIFMDEIASVVIVANFCFAFAFNGSDYLSINNYILPYSFASTLCMLFISASLYYFIKYIESERPVHLLVWSIFLALASFSRPETVLPVWIVFVVCGLFVKNRGYKSRLFFLVLPVVLSTAVYGITLHKMQAIEGFSETLVERVMFAVKGKDPFAVWVSGYDDLAYNVFLIFKSFLFHLLVVAGLCFGSHLVTRYIAGNGRKRINLVSGITAIVITLIFAFKFIGNSEQHIKYFGSPDLQYRSIPLVLVIALLLSVVNMLKGNEYKYNHKLFTTAFVALMLVSKIFFNATSCPYGFYLLNIGLVVYYIFFINLMPVVNRKFYPASTDRISYYSLLLVFVCLSLASWGLSANVYAKKSLKIDSGKGTVYSFNDERSISYWDTVDYLKRNTQENDTLVVFPEGASINFYSGRPNPTKYYLFSPVDLEKIGENTVINQLNQNRVAYIAIVHGPYAPFGVDYGFKLSAWIHENYTPVFQFGFEPFGPEQCWTLLLKRKDLN